MDKTLVADHTSVNKKGHPRIVVSRFGQVEHRDVDAVLNLMDECYDRLAPHTIDFVDLYVFERSSAMSAFMTEESQAVGVASASFSDLFFAMHDAFRGTSRILLCLEHMKLLPPLVQDGGIRHEVAHSVLHGSLLYYALSLPPALSDLVTRRHMSRAYATNLLYLIAIAVKDFEVSRLLSQRGYLAGQIAYAKHLLTVTEPDRLAWNLSKGHPSAEIVCLVSSLKPAACVAPFLWNTTFGEDLKRLLTKNLAHFGLDLSARLLHLTHKDFPSLGPDTITNINQMVDRVVETIVNPLLLK